MTDNEIIKIFTVCITSEDCSICPMFRNCPTSFAVQKAALDLINRQKAENLGLQNKVELLEQDKKMSKEDSDKSKAAAMEVIKKQEAEIERLKHLEKNVYEAVEELTNKIKTEAVKECFEKVRKRLAVHSFTSNSTEYTDGQLDCMLWVDSEIYELEKEMVGEN